MNLKQKILVVVGSVAVMASSGAGGYYLFATTDTDAPIATTQSTSVTPVTSQPTSTATTPANTSTQTQTPTQTTVVPTPSPTPTPTPTPAPAPTPTPTPAPAPAPTYTYRNGTYVATVNYSVPSHTNSITVTLTVKNDVVTAVSDQHSYKIGSDSETYISSFESKISGVVVGKSLAGLSPSRVGGASLTTGGFDSALNIIRTNAKA